MILITINDLKESDLNMIKNIAGENSVYHVNKDNNIPYEDIEIMITYGLIENWKLLKQLPNLKWVQLFQTGIEKVPLKTLGNRNIRISNVKNIYGAPMSEYAMSLILYQVREIERFRKNKKLKFYDRKQLVDEVNKKTIGIFGTGYIGKEVAKKAKAFDMKVLGFNTTGRKVENFDETFTWSQKEEIITKCDFLVLLLPLVNETKGFIGEKEFKLMKEEAYLINIGRGPLIDETALINALNNYRIKGAALDVFNEEPLPKASKLWEAKNLIITPHLSGKTKYFFERCIQIFDKNYQSYKSNEELIYKVNSDTRY